MEKVYYENSDSSSIIEDWLSYHRKKEYIQWVAKQFYCNVSDLVYIDVHPDFIEEDEEGFNIESFFARGTEIKSTLTHSDMEDRNCKINELVFKDFTIGDVCRVEADGKIFYADYNASPIGVITKKIELW